MTKRETGIVATFREKAGDEIADKVAKLREQIEVKLRNNFEQDVLPGLLEKAEENFREKFEIDLADNIEDVLADQLAAVS